MSGVTQLYEQSASPIFQKRMYDSAQEPRLSPGRYSLGSGRYQRPCLQRDLPARIDDLPRNIGEAEFG